MKQVDNLGNGPNQQTKITLDDGTVVAMNFRYLPAVQRWMFDVSHPDITLLGSNLCLHPNILRAFRNTIRFGLACVSTDGVDPVDINAFSSGRVAVFILEASEVLDVEQNIFGSAI